MASCGQGFHTACKPAELRELSLASNPLINDDIGGDDDDGDAPMLPGAGLRPPSPRRGAFPANFPALRRLKVLTLNCCDLEQVPDILGEVPSLHTVHMSENRARAREHAFFFLPLTCSSLRVRPPPPTVAPLMIGKPRLNTVLKVLPMCSSRNDLVVACPGSCLEFTGGQTLPEPWCA